MLNRDICLKIIVVEQDDSPKIKINNNDVTYIFVYNSGFFNRGWGFNVGFKAIDADYYFFADNDIILKNDNIIYVFLKCFKYDAVKPYSQLYNSTKNYIEDLEFNPCVFNSECKKMFTKRCYTCFGGGIVGLNKKSINIISGWDERFRGRGWEDYAFTAKIKLFLYKLCTYNFCALHLWHECEKDTIKTINCDLNKKYQMYDVWDYINLIEKSHNFGSPLKYSQLGKIKKDKYCEFIYKKRIKYAHYMFNKIYNRVTKKYKLSKNTRKIYTYLDLCDQLCHIAYYNDQCENKCIDLYESGC